MSTTGVISALYTFNTPLNFYGGARGVTVNVVGNGHGDTSSNP